jgi:hypothetical protein
MKNLSSNLTDHTRSGQSQALKHAKNKPSHHQKEMQKR